MEVSGQLRVPATLHPRPAQRSSCAFYH